MLLGLQVDVIEYVSLAANLLTGILCWALIEDFRHYLFPCHRCNSSQLMVFGYSIVYMRYAMKRNARLFVMINRPFVYNVYNH